jgi:hypothetical protein
VQDRDDEQEYDLDNDADPRRPLGRSPSQPAGQDHASTKGQQRENEPSGIVPIAVDHIGPEKDQIGGLRIGEDAMDDPGVGLEISPGQRQQAGDQQRLFPRE